MEEKRNEKRDEKRKSNNRTVIIVLSVIVGLGILSNFFGEKEPQTNNETAIKEETTTVTTEAGTPSTTEITAEMTTVADTTETPQEYKESCQAMDYKTIARQPELYEGKNIKVTGEVWQVVEEGDDGGGHGETSFVGRVAGSGALFAKRGGRGRLFGVKV